MAEHDYDMTLSALSEWLNAKSPPFADAGRVVWLNAETIRHALETMARMESENLVMVPREPTSAMIGKGNFASDEEFPAVETIYKAMIEAASQEKKDG